MACKDCIHYGICEYSPFTDKPIKCQHFKNRLRFVELPCNIGDTVYFITGIHNKLIKPATVEEVRLADPAYSVYVSTDNSVFFVLQDWELFLTKEDAEAALAERKANGSNAHNNN